MSWWSRQQGSHGSWTKGGGGGWGNSQRKGPTGWCCKAKACIEGLKKLSRGPWTTKWHEDECGHCGMEWRLVEAELAATVPGGAAKGAKGAPSLAAAKVVAREATKSYLEAAKTGAVKKEEAAANGGVADVQEMDQEEGGGPVQ